MESAAAHFTEALTEVDHEVVAVKPNIESYSTLSFETVEEAS